MKLLTSLFVILIFSLSFCFAETGLKFEKTTIIDKITSDNKLYKFSFRFKNEKKYRIEILDIETPCGCTVVDVKKFIYEPGDDGIIKGIFKVENRLGLQEKSIILHTDDLNNSSIRLTLKIDILNEIEAKPRLLHWVKDSDIETKNVVLTIYNKLWEVTSIEFDRSKFKLKNTKYPDNYIIEVTPTSTSSIIRDTIKVKLINKRKEKRLLAIHVLVK